MGRCLSALSALLAPLAPLALLALGSLLTGCSGGASPGLDGADVPGGDVPAPGGVGDGVAGAPGAPGEPGQQGAPAGNSGASQDGGTPQVGAPGDSPTDATPSTGGPLLAIAEPDDESAPLWDQGTLPTFELELSEADLALLDADPAAEQYVPAAFTFEGERHDDVGLRYKGSIGAFIGCTAGGVGGGGGGGFSVGGAKTCPKLSMKVSFNWVTPGGRFRGLKKLQFHSMNSDDSLMRDRLGYALFRAMGIAAPRALHARLMVNGAYAGLFVMIEQIDSRFTRAHFDDGGDGNVYKEIWPRWSDPAVYLPPALQTNEDDPGVSTERVARFASELEAAATPADVAALSGRWMDNDYVMRFIAVDRGIQHDDGMFHWYCGLGLGNNPDTCSNHNFYMYEGALDDQLRLVPWDLDLTMGGAGNFVLLPGAWNDPMPVCTNMQQGGFGGALPAACDKLTRGWGELDAEYAATLREFVGGPFSAASVGAKLDAWAAQIAPSVSDAAAVGHSPSPQAWQQELAALRAWIDQQRSTLSAMAQ